MFRSTPRPTHRAQGPAVVDYRALAVPVGRTMGGMAVLSVAAATTAVIGAESAQAVGASSPAPSANSPAVAPSAPSAPVSASPVSAKYTSVKLRSGSRGAAVTQLQKSLRSHGVSVSADGVFGPRTLSAVKSFQRSAKINVDGVVGPITWGALNGSSGGASKPGGSSSSHPTLHRGDRSSAVTTMQKALWKNRPGYNATGYFGSVTQASVKSFQRSVGLSADGVVGAKTWNALLNGQSGGSGGGGSSSFNGASMVSLAKAQVGIGYTWGGQTPSSGFDCSGLVNYVYKAHGISVPRTANQLAHAGRIISQSQAKPGDLVAFSGNNWGHIGIYAGNGMIVDASGSQQRVTYRSIWNAPHVFVTYR